VAYFFSNTYSPAGTRSVMRTYRVTAIVDIPPVLVDLVDQQNVGVLPPGATRQLLAYYLYAGVGVRLDRGPAGIPGLQHHLAVLASPAWASWASSGRAAAGARPTRLATASREMSGPGCRPSSRNTRAAALGRLRYDQARTVRGSLAGLSLAMTSSASAVRRSSPERSVSV
jgi:hypothetical protein